MKKFWLAPCFALGVALYAGTAQAAYWQVIRDTPVRTDAAADAKVLGTARKGWIVSDMTGEDSGPQWIKMVEFETKPGEGMAYAYLVFNSPDAYVSAADVVQVHEDGMFQQQTEIIQSEQGQGVHIHHLPAPQTDNAALKTALESWVQECNAVLSTYQAMAPDKAAEAIMAWEDESPFPDKSIEAVQNSAEPLLNRWINSLYALPKVPLSADDKKMLGVLADYGLLPQMAEGIPFLTVDMNVLRKRISFEPPMVAYTAFRALLDSQPTVLFADGGCLYSVKEMGTWAVQWEHYLKTVPADSVYFREGKKRYLAFITYSLLSDLPNTPAFPGYNKGRMEKEWVASLKYVASENPGTQTAAIIAEFLKKVKANGNKLAPLDKKVLLTKLNVLLVPQTTASATKSIPMEEKLLGKHMFSLQWIEGPMGEAVVSRTETGGLRIDARQEHKGDFVTLNGDVRILDDKNFVVTGVLVTRVSHIAGGKPCPRSGEFTFRVTKNRKYWRLQQMDNPCDPVVDYVDVYFKGL